MQPAIPNGISVQRSADKAQHPGDLAFAYYDYMHSFIRMEGQSIIFEDTNGGATRVRYDNGWVADSKGPNTDWRTLNPRNAKTSFLAAAFYAKGLTDCPDWLKGLRNAPIVLLEHQLKTFWYKYQSKTGKDAQYETYN